MLVSLDVYKLMKGTFPRPPTPRHCVCARARACAYEKVKPDRQAVCTAFLA